MKKIIIALCLAFLLSPAYAQQQILKSFGYGNVGCVSVSGAPLLSFDVSGDWQICSQTFSSACVIPGAGTFPTTNFWLRAIALTVGNVASNWTLIGHSGPNGDWVTGPVWANNSQTTIVFPYDAAPLFNISSEYFDAHVSTCSGVGSGYSYVNFWYTPAP